MEEIWKDIPNYEGFYQASNLGRIRGVDRIINNKRGSYLIKGKIKKLKEHRDGYLHIHLDKKGKRKWFMVHRLIAITFIPNPNNLPCINHKNENKKDNCVKNLEFCTYLYNNTYGTRIEKVKSKKSIPIIQYDKNGNFIAKYKSIKETSKILNINATIISNNTKYNDKAKRKYFFKREEI